ncbi:MAG: hypothetical protein LQ351_007831 [Letrouitia transgressa]|nr:MAG: hypothetical protein LQ351_007831 [Letrouitia transgressa]
MSSNSENSGTSDSPSLLHGHAAYASGAAKETLGSYISTSLQSTGAADKQAGIDEMRTAKAAQPQSSEDRNATVGKMEASVGGAVGCGGMVEEGEGRQQ